MEERMQYEYAIGAEVKTEDESSSASGRALLCVCPACSCSNICVGPQPAQRRTVKGTARASSWRLHLKQLKTKRLWAGNCRYSERPAYARGDRTRDRGNLV